MICLAFASSPCNFTSLNHRLNTLPTIYKTGESHRTFFIDLYKDGKLDLMTHRISSSSYNTGFAVRRSEQIQVYYNNEHYDAFFMKVRVMRGSNYESIRNNLVVPGGNVNCFVTSLGGEMLPKVGNQHTQLGRTLQLPYVFFGLGRTNNYVNELTITIPYVRMLSKLDFIDDVLLLYVDTYHPQLSDPHPCKSRRSMAASCLHRTHPANGHSVFISYTGLDSHWGGHLQTHCTVKE